MAATSSVVSISFLDKEVLLHENTLDFNSSSFLPSGSMADKEFKNSDYSKIIMLLEPIANIQLIK